MNQINNIAIVGGGLMGAGIAQVFLTAGFTVTLYDPSSTVRDSAKSRILNNMKSVGADAACIEDLRICSDLSECVLNADFVIEAAQEKLELKQSIFKQLEQCAPADAILASNTSVIPISRISQGLESASRMLATHWWNPPYLVPLVEVVQGEQTSESAIDKTIGLLKRAGKSPAHIKKDVPGFVANRLQHALWREAIAMVADGICDAKTLDDCVKNSFGLRLSVLGPLENADLVGLDLTRDIHSTIFPALNRDSTPNQFLDQRISVNALGCKTGDGFYHWTKGAADDVRSKLNKHLLELLGKN